MSRLLACSVVLLAMTGCSSSSTGVSSVVNHAAETACRQFMRCDQGGNADTRWIFASEADCRALMTAQFAANVDAQPYIDDHTASVDGSALSACLSALSRDACVPTRYIPACDQIFVGRLPAGAGCSDDQQCQSGACNAGFNQCGTCLASAAIGETCDAIQQNCAPSTDGFVRCEVGVAGPTCVLDTTSYLTVSLGQSCANGNGVRRFCESPYYCDNNDLCAERKAPAASCDPGLDECDFGLSCVDGPSGPTCQTIVVATTVNAACGSQANGTFVRCDRTKRLYCDNNGGGGGNDVCLELAGTGAQNSDCLVQTDCDRGFVCVLDAQVGTPGTCESTGKADSTTCSIDAECASGYCQPGGAGPDVCAALPVCP